MFLLRIFIVFFCFLSFVDFFLFLKEFCCVIWCVRWGMYRFAGSYYEVLNN